MIVLEILILILLLLASAFVIGKKIGQRKHIEVLKQMKALELKYENMVDDMEKSSMLCSDLIGTETDKFIELLNIIDEKCLYANDIIANLDNAGNTLKQTSLHKKPSNTNLINNNEDTMFKEELKESLKTMFTKIVDIEDRINMIENKQIAVSSTLKEGANNKDRLDNMHNELQNLVSKLDRIDREAHLNLENMNFIPIPETHNVDNSVAEDNSSPSINISTDTLDAKFKFESEKRPTHKQAYGPADEHIEEPDKKSDYTPHTSSKADDQLQATSECLHNAILPETKAKFIYPAINDTPKFIEPNKQRTRVNTKSGKKNSIVNEVLRQIDDGVAIPQIARSLGIGKGEIDLILNIYGNTKMKGHMEKCL